MSSTSGSPADAHDTADTQDLLRQSDKKRPKQGGPEMPGPGRTQKGTKSKELAQKTRNEKSNERTCKGSREGCGSHHPKHRTRIKQMKGCQRRRRDHRALKRTRGEPEPQRTNAATSSTPYQPENHTGPAWSSERTHEDSPEPNFYQESGNHAKVSHATELRGARRGCRQGQGDTARGTSQAQDRGDGV